MLQLFDGPGRAMLIAAARHDLVGVFAYRVVTDRAVGRQRDWLLGRNPWGTSMFTGIPNDGEHPQDVHTSVWALTRENPKAGLVDGPVLQSIYSQLKGIRLYESDEFEHLQNDYVVYHDDIGDYATNEPTMDGTAGAVFWMAHFALGADR